MGRFMDWLIGPAPELMERAEGESTAPASAPPPTPPQGSGVMPPPPPGTEHRAVTHDQALGLDSIYRAVAIIATAISQLSIDVFRSGSEITAPAWVREPDVDSTPPAFWEETATSLALNGNAFWQVLRSPDSGAITNLRILPPLDVTVTFDASTGRRVYGYKGRDLPTREVRHLSLLRVPGRARGLGPIQAAQASLAGALDLRDYASGWFRDSGVPSGVLSTDQALSPDQADEHKRRWRETQGGRREVAVLGRGLDYKPVMLAPKDAQFLESQNFTVTALARLFGIPAHLVLAAVEGGSQTYTNVAQADLTFVRWTLSRYTREIETAVGALLPRGQSARFNLDALLRPDTKARYEAHKIALDAGFLTRDEVRAIEGYAPLDDDSEEAS